MARSPTLSSSPGSSALVPWRRPSRSARTSRRPIPRPPRRPAHSDHDETGPRLSRPRPSPRRRALRRFGDQPVSRRGPSALRDVGFYLRARLNGTLRRALNRRGDEAMAPVASVEDVLAGPRDPLSLARLVVGRDNAEREAAVATYLERRGLPVARHAFATFEGSGQNFHVDVGAGDRVLVLIAHHDAVPGSPGANDNAAALGILLYLIDRAVRPRVSACAFSFPRPKSSVTSALASTSARRRSPASPAS